jgi:hypothetical protein
MKLPGYGSVQREITINSHFLSMKKQDFSSEKRDFSSGGRRLRGDDSKESVARELEERFDFADLVSRAPLVP